MADLKKSKIKSHSCEACRYSMCGDCNLTHSTDDVTKHHGIHANPDVFIGYRGQCNVTMHAGKILWSWCLTCLLPVCQRCVTDDIHDSHKIVDIVTEYRHRKEQTKKSITSIRDDFLQRCLAMYEQKSSLFFTILLKNISYEKCQPEKLKNIINVALKVKLPFLRLGQRTIMKQREILIHFIKSLESVFDDEKVCERPVSYLKTLKKVSFVYDRDYLDPSVKLETKMDCKFSEDDIEVMIFKSQFSPMQFPKHWMKRNKYTNEEGMQFLNALDTDFHETRSRTCQDCLKEFPGQWETQPEIEVLLRWCRACKHLVCPQCVTTKKHKKHEIVDIESEYRLQRKQTILSSNTCSFITNYLLPKCRDMEKQVNKKKEFFSRENLKYQNAFLAEKLKNIINVALKSKMNDLRQSQITVFKQSENLLHFIKSLEIVLDEERAFQTPVSFLVALKKYHVIQPVKLETKLISRFSEENIEKGMCQNYFLPMDFGARLISEEELHVSGRPTHISPCTEKKIWVSSSGTLYVHNFSFKYQKYDPIKDICISENGVHTVRKSKQPIYIDINGDLKSCSLLTNFTSALPLKRSDEWVISCIYCSPRNENLLVGLKSVDDSKVTVYDDLGNEILTIQVNEKHQNLYCNPVFITENRNGDIVVSDRGTNSVVVTDQTGNFRFTIDGNDVVKRKPGFYSVCTDCLSRILICSGSGLLVFDKNGTFQTYFTPRESLAFRGYFLPYALCYDTENEIFWVVSTRKKRYIVSGFKF